MNSYAKIQGGKDTVHYHYAERERRPVFRQSSELCLIWLHDILHISHQAQRPLFALVLTPLSHALILWLNSHLPPRTHASCCIYLFLSFLLSSVLSCFILPYPANLMSLLSLPLSPARSLPLSPFPPLHSLSLSASPSFSSLPLLWRSAMMQSQRARPCLITLIKHPVR